MSLLPTVIYFKSTSGLLLKAQHLAVVPLMSRISKIDGPSIKLFKKAATDKSPFIGFPSPSQ